MFSFTVWSARGAYVGRAWFADDTAVEAELRAVHWADREGYLISDLRAVAQHGRPAPAGYFMFRPVNPSKPLPH
jgi:hypothetical protein